MSEPEDDADSNPMFGPARGAGFDAMYAGTPPWDIGRPQPAFVQLADRGLVRGRVLDVGCGTGEHALMASALGLEATGIDSSPTAIDLAKHKAKERGLEARFILWDALELPSLPKPDGFYTPIALTHREQFDTIIDSGLFHVFDDDDRATFVRAFGRSLRPEAGTSCSALAIDSPAGSAPGG